MDLLTILEKTVSPGKLNMLKTQIWVLTSTGILNFLHSPFCKQLYILTYFSVISLFQIRQN